MWFLFFFFFFPNGGSLLKIGFISKMTYSLLGVAAWTSLCGQSVTTILSGRHLPIRTLLQPTSHRFFNWCFIYCWFMNFMFLKCMWLPALFGWVLCGRMWTRCVFHTVFSAFNSLVFWQFFQPCAVATFSNGGWLESSTPVWCFLL